MQTIYLDNNATTQPAEEVVAAMDAALHDLWQNPSSTHRAGQRVRRHVDLARQAVAELIGCKDRQIIFTCGGTEADNMAVFGTLEAYPERGVLVTSRTEHDAIRDAVEHASGQGAEVVWLPLDGDGVVDCNALGELLQRRGTEIAVVSIMWANNETGVIQPIETIGNLCREHEVLFHTDAVQWVGKMPTNVADLPIDMMSFSGHKFHGPKGVGALYVRRGIRLAKRSHGGSQERDRRGGTENVPGILGLGAAAKTAQAWLATPERERLGALRDRFAQSILDMVDDARVNSAGAERMWNTASIGFRGLEADAIILVLSEHGICASAGAACASGSLEPSPILLAMGVEEAYAHGSVRFSLSRYTTEAEIDRALEVVPEVVAKLRRSMAGG